ncbi:DUF1617 family protein [Pseudobacteroides cellulosolvens]|uniref:Uncharacterized protein n=1 Tax=Pseudobacteroides cellulosolvens ATCC 35603 = DSM 2933 TaxID=398512 RepID=A0A0L6JM79_9FIRM|nr:DUF1617 family protein [Pseudobacteroides cellulosolvens]KNY26507.1 hypothetical protein Bccel_1772 [Pseudobacteroides cellulosolvens ATCC 35603 = DSM 2933]
MKKFTFISGILALFVSLFLIISLKFQIPIYLTLAVPAFLFIYAFKSSNLPDKKLSLTVSILSLASIVVFLMSVIFMILNLPVGKPFEQKLQRVSVLPEKEEIYNRINFRIKQLSITLDDNRNASKDFDDLVDKYDYNNEIISKTLNDSQIVRNELVKLFTEAAFSIPEKFYMDRYLESAAESEAFYGPRLSSKYQFENHISFFKLELTDISKLFNSGDYDEGFMKYLNLWKCEDVFISSNNISIDNILIFESSIKLLIEFYNSNQNTLKKHDLTKLLSLSENIQNKMTQGFQRALSKEYEIASHNLSQLKYNWPFLDYNKTSKLYHDMFVNIANKADNIGDSNAVFPNTNDIKLKNPVGNSCYQKVFNAFNGIEDNFIEVKALLEKFNKDMK